MEVNTSWSVEPQINVKIWSLSKASIDVIVPFFSCQIANITKPIWCKECLTTCLLSKKKVMGKMLLMLMCDINVIQQLTSQKHSYLTYGWWSDNSVDLILMSIEHYLLTGDTGGNMSALCPVLIYFCLSIRAYVEVKHGHRIYISKEL